MRYIIHPPSEKDWQSADDWVVELVPSMPEFQKIAETEDMKYWDD